VVLRLLVVSPIAAIFAIGGVALADEAGIVDPWAADRSGWFGAPAAEPAADIARVGAAPGIAAPLAAASPAALGDHALVVEPWNAAPPELASDPWVTRAPERPRATPVTASVQQRRHAEWAYVIDEIVDPWRRSGGRAAQDPLIVDPWAR
jgi:hypothetical protein